MNIATAIQGLGRPVVYYPRLAQALGDIRCSILTCHLLYWSGKGHDAEGWIWKTQEEIEEETAIGRRGQETARARLVELGVLEEKYDRLNHRMYFRINQEKLVECWNRTFPNVQTVPSRMYESAIRECPKAPVDIISAESTTESTTESKNGAPPASPGGHPPNGDKAAPKKRKYESRTDDYRELKAFVVDHLKLTQNDAAALWEHWEGNGWKVNGRPMQSWKHTASKWKRLGYLFPSLQTQSARRLA